MVGQSNPPDVPILCTDLCVWRALYQPAECSCIHVCGFMTLRLVRLLSLRQCIYNEPSAPVVREAADQELAALSIKRLKFKDPTENFKY